MNRTRLWLFCGLVGLSPVGEGCVWQTPPGEPAPAALQRPRLQIGQRLRLTAAAWGMDKAIVTLAGLSAESIAVTSRSRTVALPLGAVRRLEMSRGPRSRALAGAVNGVLTGALIGLGVGALSAGSCEGEFLCGAGLVVLPPIGAAVGLVVGTIHGAFSRGDRWETVPLAALREGRFEVIPRGQGVQPGAADAAAR
jgi:hypothetical protein